MTNRFAFGPPGALPNSAAPIAPPMASQQGTPASAFTQTVNLISGAPQKLLDIRLPTPGEISFIAGAPYSIQPNFPSVPYSMQDDGLVTPHDLRILGVAKIGLGNITSTVNFDIPLGQASCATVIAQSVEVSCRLYDATLADAAAAPGGKYDTPANWTGNTWGGPGDSRVAVQAIGFQGRLSGTNLSRRAYARALAAGATQVFYCPSYATNFRLIGPSGATFAFSAYRAFAGFPVTYVECGAGYTPAAGAVPLPSDCAIVTIKNNAVAAADFELVWDISLGGGFPS